jgi:hypothetical protein
MNLVSVSGSFYIVSCSPGEKAMAFVKSKASLITDKTKRYVADVARN